MSRRRRSAAALLALALTALGVVLACPGAALAEGYDPTPMPGRGGGMEGSGAVHEGSVGHAGSSARPQLLLVHGGSFLYQDPFFEPLTRGRAIAAGFVPHFVNYPLGNLPAAVDKVREEAGRLRRRFGVDRVYAYGASAGATLAALLSGDRLVSAAVAKAPISDLTTWDWPTGRYGPEYWSSLGVDLEDRERLSPIRRPQLEPLLVIQGRADNVVPPAMNETFAAAYPRVRLWLVAGGHTTERVRPYLITRAMDWLAKIAARRIRATRAAERARHNRDRGTRPD